MRCIEFLKLSPDTNPSVAKEDMVTGANKGIGYATVKGLCKQFEGDVILTARNEKLGKQAVENLSNEGLPRIPKFHQLDIIDKDSIDRLKLFLQQTYGGLDVLVNNAAIAYKSGSKAPLDEQAEVTIRTNYTALLDVCEALFPILRPHARVVNVSSFVSGLSIARCSSDIKAKFTEPHITIDKCTEYMKDFVQSVKEGKHKTRGYTSSSYGMSKIGVTVLSIIQGKEMIKDSRDGIIVNAADPGWVKTDMSSNSGPKTIDQGADTILYLALLPTDKKSPIGEFVSERAVVDWTVLRMPSSL